MLLILFFNSACYAPGINRILSLDALGNKISVLDMNCNLDKRFNPMYSKQFKDARPI